MKLRIKYYGLALLVGVILAVVVEEVLEIDVPTWGWALVGCALGVVAFLLATRKKEKEWWEDIKSERWKWQ